MTQQDGWVGIDHLVTTEDAAALLAVSEWTMRRLRRTGEVPAIRVGNSWRFDPADLRTYITEQRTNA